MRWARYGVLAIGVAVGCDDGGDGGSGAPPDDGLDRRALVASLGEHVVLPTYARFLQRASELREAARALAGAPGDASRRETAQAAWRSAMTVWQEAELMRVGPAGAPDMTTGGRSLRDALYSWPTVNPCRVDQVVAERAYAEAGFFDAALPNVFGLDALEYLLFAPTGDHACPPNPSLDINGTWPGLGDEEVARRRADYAVAAADRLHRDAEALVAAWEGDGGFLAVLKDAGGSGSPFPTARAALDEVFAAMFYLDLVVKDLKLAIPMGISTECAAETCPDRVESLWAHASKEHLAANLRGFRALFVGNGADGPTRTGFDDALAALGAADLASQMVRDIDAAIAAVEGLEGTLEQALAADPAKVRAAYEAVKKVTDVMKSQMTAALALTLPREGAADND